ncbi:uncharacterized protein LOC134231105 [Saccostrea cucullata]|uniref:uncharacterized protein LOC134231105 n=1 Tax=Saccostrea cuccullata TaxID=36930 RepID=UPI002ED1F785
MENTLTVGECEAECTKDSFCEGFAYRTDNSRCQLSTSNSGTPSFCSSCYFHKRQCSTGGGSGGVVTVAGGVVTTAVGVVTTEGGVVTTEGGVVTTGGTSSTEMVTKIETTETPSSEIITSTQSTIEKTTNNWLTTPIEVISTSNSIQCSCVCIELNITLEESIERRKKELEINVDELSSTKRKLVSVDDPRPSAKTIGYVGLAFCVLLGALIVIPDFFSVVFFIFRRIKNRSY